MYVAFIVNKPAIRVFPIPVPGPNFQNNFFSLLIVNIIQHSPPSFSFSSSLILSSLPPPLSLSLFTHPLSISLSIFISIVSVITIDEAIGEITILFDHNDRYGAQKVPRFILDFTRKLACYWDKESTGGSWKVLRVSGYTENKPPLKGPLALHSPSC